MKKYLKSSSLYILVGIALVLTVLGTATNSGDVLAQQAGFHASLPQPAGPFEKHRM